MLITVERCGDEAKVAVTDRGVGMTPEELIRCSTAITGRLEAIRGSEGLGLGLFITKSFVEAHGDAYGRSQARGRDRCSTSHFHWQRICTRMIRMELNLGRFLLTVNLA